MYGILTYIWLEFMVNVYTIITWILWECSKESPLPGSHLQVPCWDKNHLLTILLKGLGKQPYIYWLWAVHDCLVFVHPKQPPAAITTTTTTTKRNLHLLLLHLLLLQLLLIIKPQHVSSRKGINILGGLW